MNNYTWYFDEWSVPPAGIDTISIWIHPYLVNKPLTFHKKGNANKAVNLRIKQEKDHLTKRPVRTNHIMDIQAEAINPNDNILNQVYAYIVTLFQEKILTIRNFVDEYLMTNFINTNFNQLFAVNFIDFYFDINEDDAVLLGKKDSRFPNTQYSSDNSVKTYDRAVRLKQKNTIPHQYIDEIENKRRIEFHLNRETCRYLNCCNLDGTFDMVFLRYLPFLARKWLKYRRDIISIPNLDESSYYYLKQINTLANKRTIPHNKPLMKTPLKPIPFKKAKKNETDHDWFARFSSGK
jgi:hypothetical protein